MQTSKPDQDSAVLNEILGRRRGIATLKIAPPRVDMIDLEILRTRMARSTPTSHEEIFQKNWKGQRSKATSQKVAVENDEFLDNEPPEVPDDPNMPVLPKQLPQIVGYQENPVLNILPCVAEC